MKTMPGHSREPSKNAHPSDTPTKGSSAHDPPRPPRHSVTPVIVSWPADKNTHSL
jgi:hypothetical protein